jgi:hypothetical protein
LFVKMRRFIMTAVVVGSAMIPFTSATGQKPALGMLDSLQKGMWELRFRESGEAARRICLGDGRRFIQLRHSATNCDRLVVKDSADAVTVQYTCPGQGYGRTNIRRETSSLIQLESQGIADGLPFSFVAEARRVGGC